MPDARTAKRTDKSRSRSRSPTAGCGALLRGFNEARRRPGFKREGVLLATTTTPAQHRPGLARPRARLLERLRTLPGADAPAQSRPQCARIHGLPLRSFTIEGRARTGAAPDQALSNTVTPGYLRTMGIPLLAGSDLADLRDTTLPAQVIVNEEFVRRFIGGGEALGRRVENRGTAYVIAGIARNSTSESFGEAPSPVVYFSYRDRPSERGEIHLRTRAGAESLLAPELERIVRGLDPSLPLYDVRTLNEHVEKNLFLRRIPARMFVVLVLPRAGRSASTPSSPRRLAADDGDWRAAGAGSDAGARGRSSASLRIVAAGAFVRGSSPSSYHSPRPRWDRCGHVRGVPFAPAGRRAASWLPARRDVVGVMSAE